ncbi:MAG: response regulator [Pseudomonadota bacterium]
MILLIDDDPLCRLDLSEALTICGLRPLAADSGERGLEMLRQRDIAAVVTDWQMPGMDGLAVAEAVRRTRPQIPVVMITGAVEWAQAAEAAQAQGVCRCLRKPIDLRALLDCLRGVVGGNRNRAATGADVSKAEAAGR